ncbi:MAG TPA: S46 family peptidase, partial [Planctomycetaceae bacterium]|nr:S46 family peptidase [Planctomycetaceae bacterium]
MSLHPQRFCLGFLALAFVTNATAAALADEGMWLFNRPPRQILKERYGFEPTKEWLDHVQRASVRFNVGGSGSFISPEGLVMTNHHVGADALQKLSDATHNYLKDGFYAKTRADEKKCLDLELNVLESIEDVTDRVNAAVKPGMTPEQAFIGRRAAMNEIENESKQKTGLRSDVITLYQGGEYDLYRYKQYTDVRLVFAPEQQIAFYGGDPDNFEYPRYDLDCCFFRVYENGKPVQGQEYFKWSAKGAGDNELVFVSGNPGRTNRLDTVDALRYQRDIAYPYTLNRLYSLEVLLTAWGARSDENARRARDLFFGVANSRKARDGGLAGLLDPAVFAQKIEAEKQLRAAVEHHSDLQPTASAWGRIAEAQKVRAHLLHQYSALERGLGFNSTLFQIARDLVRAADEKARPDRERLREYTNARRSSLELGLFSEEPIYRDFEILKLTNSLTWLEPQLLGDRKLYKQIMADKSPADRAAELVQTSKLESVELRKKLYEGGKTAVDASNDPMILLARLVDPPARAVRKQMESQVEEVERQAYGQIAKAKYEIEGKNTYPDATFTLRLAFGTVKGYEEQGKHIPFETHFAGLYERAAEHHDKEPFDLPKRWVERKYKLDLGTPFNFVCTADIIGGNSGSPVINKEAEIVGLIFDGNIQSLVLDFL